MNSGDIQQCLCHYGKVGQSLGLHPIFLASNAAYQSLSSILSYHYPLLILRDMAFVSSEIDYRLLGNGIMLCY